MKTTAILMATLLGCGGSSGGAGDDAVDASAGQDTSSQVDAPVASARTIFTIVLENHDYAEIVGSADAPYLNSLIAQGALATNYSDTIHPSLGNYLYMISGANQYPGIVDISPTQTPFFPADQPHLGTQLQAAGIKWRAYMESMGTPCNLSNAGKYAPKHNPFVYFVDLQSDPNGVCAQTNVDYSEFAADLATNEYRFMWITPNLDSDGHDPGSNPVLGLQQSDLWMSQEVPKILASAGFQNGGILFVTWDEAEGRDGNDGDKIPMIVLSPRVKMAGMTSSTAMNHGAYLATVEDQLGLPRLATVATSPTLIEFLSP
ncbi:MAG: putative acid phosphatase [Deltaproteobacteria bacterium]|nr:putative acid phosphatase [Deltaproteobacteria bacterium]